MYKTDCCFFFWSYRNVTGKFLSLEEVSVRIVQSDFSGVLGISSAQIYYVIIAHASFLKRIFTITPFYFKAFQL